MGNFVKISENQITRAILTDFYEKMLGNTKVDCIVVGAGPSGLMAARELAINGVDVLLIEANNYLGGGFWIGGYLMNGVTVREPANEILDEIGVPYKEIEKGLYLANGPHACSKLIASACDAGVKILNMTKFDDLVLRENNRVGGVVINWTPVSALPRNITCVDPIALESHLVIDATGHDAVVVNSLAKRGLLKIKGFNGMWVEKSEDMIVEKTMEIHPGLIVCGMAVATVFGIYRMGPTFGSMLLSGKKAAQIAQEILLEHISKGEIHKKKNNLKEKVAQF
jgi:thiamine thiazole synthase